MNKLQDIFDVRGRTILITGACGFFGKHITRLFLELECNVILLSHSKELREMTYELRRQYNHSNEVKSHHIDFYAYEDFEELLKKIVSLEHIDVVINNAYDMSIATGFTTSLEKLTFKKWNAAFQSGLYWAFLTSKIIGSKMKEEKFGSIINISSMYGKVAPDPELYRDEIYFNSATYGTVKAGLLGLTRYVASFLGESGVRCNAILPGPFPNPVKVELNSEFVEKLKGRTVLKRVGNLKDLDGLLVYLASDSSTFMTGQALSLDGGWTVI